jgi:hypothetical protein
MSLIRLQPQLQLMGYEVATYGVQVAAYEVPHSKIASFLDTLIHPHFESPQLRQVLHPSNMTTAAVLHFVQSCAPSGRCDFENASVCFVRASNSARFSSTSLR